MDSENRKILAGHLACFIAYAIFGVNIIVCKDLTSGNLISPIAIFTLRSLGAGALFWTLSFFRPKEKVKKRDLPMIFLAAFLGYFVTQLTFLVAIPQITPMHCSIISSLSPIYTMFIAALVLKEPITFKKAGGVLLSLLGILFLIFNKLCAADHCNGNKHNWRNGDTQLAKNSCRYNGICRCIYCKSKQKGFNIKALTQIQVE